MATEVLELQVRTSGTQAVRSDLDHIASSAKIAEETMSLLRNALVLVGAFRIGQGLIEFLDKLDAIQDNIARVSDKADQQRAILNNLGRVAQDTASNLGDVNDVFVGLARSTSNLGVSAQDVIVATSGLVAMLKLSGTSAGDAKASIQAFNASLASGTVNGRALTAIIKNAPEIAVAIGKEFGIAGGQLKAFAANAANALPAARVFKAIEDAAPGAVKASKEAADSATDGFTRIGNAAVVFFGNLYQQIGAQKQLSDFLSNLADHIDQVALAIAALVSVLAISFVLSNFTTLIAGLGLGIVRLAYNVTLIGPLLQGMITLMETLTVVIEANPIFIGLAALALAGFLVYLSLTNTTLGDLIPTMHDVEGTVNVLIAAFVAFGGAVTRILANIPKAFAVAFQEGVNAAIDVLEFLVKAAATVINEVVRIFTSGFVDMQSQINSISFDGIKLHSVGTFHEIAADITGTFSKTFNDVYNSSPVQSLVNFGKTMYERASGYLKQLALPLTPAAVTGTLHPPGGDLGGDFLGKTDKNAAAKIQALKDQIEAAIGKFDPYIKGIAEIDKFHTLLGKNTAVTTEILAKLGITEEEVNKRMIRDIVGVGNNVTDMQGKIRLLNEAFAKGDVSAEEYAKAMRDIGGAALGIVESISPLIAANNKLADSMLAVSDAQKAGINLGLSVDEIQRRLIRDQVGVGNAMTDLVEKTQLLNDAFGKGAISAREYSEQLRKLEEAALQTQTDSLSGFQLGLLKVQDEYLDTAKDATKAVTDVFDNLQGTLEDFFKTGKLNFSKLIDGILADLTKLAIKGAITGPLSKLLGGGGYDGSTGAESDPFGGLFKAITGGFSQGTEQATSGISQAFDQNGGDVVKGMGDAFDNQGGSFISKLANALLSGGSGGAGGGGLGDIFGSLFGGGGGGGSTIGDAPGIGIGIPFATGGSVMVDGSPGRDRNFLGLKVSRGERVDVLTADDQAKEGKGGGGSWNVTQNFIFPNGDADGFKRSQGQVGAMAANGLERAKARNT